MTGLDPQLPTPSGGQTAGTTDPYAAASDPARQQAAHRLARANTDDGDHTPIDEAVYALRAALQLYGGADTRTADAAATLASLLRGVRTRPPVRTPRAGMLALPTGTPSPDELAAARLTIADQLHRYGRCEQAAREASAALAQRATDDPQPELAVAVVLIRVLTLLAACRRGSDAHQLLTEYTYLLPTTGGPLHRLTVDIAVALLKPASRKPGHSAEVCTARHTTGQPRPSADIRAEMLHRLENRPPIRQAAASSPERSALHQAIIARHADGIPTLNQIAAEAGYAYGTVHRVVNAAGRPPRRARPSHPAVWHPLRIGVATLSQPAPALPDLSRDYETSLHAALTALGHTPFALHPDASPDPDTVIALWHPGAALDSVTGLLHRHPATAVLVCDLGRQLPAGHPLRQQVGVRVVDGQAARPDTPTWPYPVPDSLWDRTGPADLAVHHRPVPALAHSGIDTAVGRLLDRAGLRVLTGPADPEIYADALTTLLPIPGRHHTTTTTGQLVQLIAAVGHGCLPLVPADTPAAELTPALLHVRSAAETAATLHRLRTQAGSRAHHELIAACRLRLATHRLSGYVPALLAHLPLPPPSTPAPGADTNSQANPPAPPRVAALTAADGQR